MPTVVCIGTLDTKGNEYAFLRERLIEHSVDVMVVDAGVHEPVGLVPDIARGEVARAGGADVAALASQGDRGAAVTAMAAGAEAIVRDLFARGRLDGIIALGGSGGSSIAAQAMRALPVGVPKLMVSTMASGDTRPYVGAVDVTMTYSVVDIAGINPISERILANAAAAIAAMAQVEVEGAHDRPLVGATMFGVTT
ncbi:MAG TPA: Tm-1-like ATP-binding domain-containing protein, partial [Gaiellaceae bacterium]|nr:Tm-1-like ATP-binding domain-containing protein [Gaiellaceae bacterium]